MWVKQFHKPSRKSPFFIGGINNSQIGGLLLSYPHYTHVMIINIAMICNDYPIIYIPIHINPIHINPIHIPLLNRNIHYYRNIHIVMPRSTFDK